MRRTVMISTLLLAAFVSVAGCGHKETVSETPVVPKPEPGPGGGTEPVVPDDPVPTSLRWTDFLDELVSWDAPTRYPTVAYESRQESSRDRRSVTPGTPEWFANDDGWGYVRMEYLNGREEKVIFDEPHPGVITRMWLTSFGSPETVVRFYFDGATEPSWQMDSYNLKDFGAWAGVSLGDGLAQPSSAWIRGSSLYLPVSYGRSCKITIEEKVEPLTVSRYYHINYRRYPDHFEVETLTPALLKANQSKVKRVNASLLVPQQAEGTPVSAEAGIPAGEALEIALPGGPSCLQSLTFTVASAGDLAEALQGIRIEGTFDGNRTVSAPLTGLCGTGRGGYYMKSWRFECNGRGTLSCRWLMPYRETGLLRLVNTGPDAVSVEVSATSADYEWTKGSMYFHAADRCVQNHPVRYWSDYANGVEWLFASLSGGRGVYVGDVYTINNHTSQWPGEGDEKIWVDDETFPSHFGTGVEDYYSFCGYFRFNTPFSGEPRLDAANFRGYNTHYRTRNLDGIPFRSRLRFYLEMEGHEAGTADLENTVFWYGDASTVFENPS